MKRSCPLRTLLLVSLFLLVGAIPSRAQWLTQTHDLKAGWNAIYLHVDPSHQTLDQWIGTDLANKVEEIWMWAPNPSAAQFVTTPQAPAQPSYWLAWARSGSLTASFTRLPGNVACLVRASADYTWHIKGKPVVPRYQWSTSGLNFIGFPTLPGPLAPSFDTLFTPVPDLRHNAEIFAYAGGAIQDNPVQILDLNFNKATRGQAYWVRSTQFNRYFGPFEVVFAGQAGARFGDDRGQISFRIKNATPADLTVTLNGVDSETPPAGQQAIQGAVPVLVRSEINPADLTFTHLNLAKEPRQWTLKPAGEPGSDIEVVLGVDRLSLIGAPGNLYASILRFTDSRNDTQIDVPVSATVGASAGLWVGDASVSAVSQYLKNYAKAATSMDMTNTLTRLGLAEGINGYHYELDKSTGRILVYGGPAPEKKGSYLVDGPIRTDSSSVPRAMPLRLIVHHDGSNTRLLQKVFHGLGAGSQTILTTRESLLQATQLASARRISAVHLPTSEANLPWSCTGQFRTGSSITTTIVTGYDNQSSNPFLHTYHPDHDNLNASYSETLAQGRESYGIRRQITLNFTPPAEDFNSLTRGSSTLTGEYVEVVTFLGSAGATRQYDVRGRFALQRISDIPTLTTP